MTIENKTLGVANQTQILYKRPNMNKEVGKTAAAIHKPHTCVRRLTNNAIMLHLVSSLNTPPWFGR